MMSEEDWCALVKILSMLTMFSLIIIFGSIPIFQ